MLIKSRAPLRLSFAGGGTDISPFCDKYGGIVLNATINKFAYCTLDIWEENFVHFESFDLNLSSTWNLNQINLEVTNEDKLKLHKKIYCYFMSKYNDNKMIPLKIATFCEAPFGSGLGSSSTIVVSIISAFSEFFNIGLDDYAIAALAYNIERVDCGLKGGQQDQYSAAFGGFNYMEFFGENEVVITPLRIKDWIVSELESSLILYFTGRSRDSSKIIDDQILSLGDGNENSLNAMKNVKAETKVMKEALLRGDFNKLENSLKRTWNSKKLTSKNVSNFNIESIYKSAINSGARAGKISGAGGGGFMFFLVPLQYRKAVSNTLKELGGSISNCNFSTKGCTTWKVNN
tara:strand:+ start:6145 stop:7185 length:1041 start_codon:yes stop_codon:yes gene_type:complete